MVELGARDVEGCPEVAESCHGRREVGVDRVVLASSDIDHGLQAGKMRAKVRRHVSSWRVGNHREELLGARQVAKR